MLKVLRVILMCALLTAVYGCSTTKTTSADKPATVRPKTSGVSEQPVDKYFKANEDEQLKDTGGGRTMF